MIKRISYEQAHTHEVNTNYTEKLAQKLPSDATIELNPCSVGQTPTFAEQLRTALKDRPEVRAHSNLYREHSGFSSNVVMTKTTETERRAFRAQVKQELRQIRHTGQEGINLDLYGEDWLMAFWHLTRNDRAFVEANVFPNQRASDIQVALDDLSAYAVARSAMLSCTARGDLKEAAVYRQHCEIYHSNLPTFARFKNKD